MNLRLLIAVAAVFLLQGFAAQAAEIRVLSAGGIRPPLEDLAVQFERASTHKVAPRFVGGAVMKQELQGSYAFDVIVAEANVVDEFIKAGKIVTSSRADVARAGVGVGMRAGGAKPDIGTTDAFRRALLNAKSVAYSKEGMAGQHFLGLLERLGIANEMKPKLVATVTNEPGRATSDLVRRGEAELGVAAIATIFVPGIELVGPIPRELQRYIDFVAGVGAGAKEPQAASAFIKFITAPEAAAAYKAKAMEPAPQR